jgi:signal transduction histidine kinase
MKDALALAPNRPHSIRGRLLVWLLGSLVVVGLAIGYAAYRRAHHDLDELLDYQLKQLAFSLSRQSVGAAPLPPGFRLPQPDFITQVWGRNGVLMFYSRRDVAIPMRPLPGFSNVDWKGESWRVFTELDGTRIIQVAHPLRLRREMAADLARRSVLPLAVLLPLLGIGIWLAVGHSLQPLSNIAAALRARTPAALEPLTDKDLPEELMPLVRALNDLLARSERALELQRQFVSDAAHELRTPLTAVQLQLQLMKRAASAQEREAAIAHLERGVQRSNRLVQQLLTLARQDPQSLADEVVDVDLVALAREVLRDFEPVAHGKRIQVTFNAPDHPVVLKGARDALHVMLSNLVDNALRYTSDGGNVGVVVAAQSDEAILEVSDNGPGIPPEQRGRVFDRFFRITGQGQAEEGSGLGLAIVKRVVERHGGQVRLESAHAVHGLKVSVRLPTRFGRA